MTMTTTTPVRDPQPSAPPEPESATVVAVAGAAGAAGAAAAAGDAASPQTKAVSEEVSRLRKRTPRVEPTPHRRCCRRRRQRPCWCWCSQSLPAGRLPPYLPKPPCL
ncbi:unnamed protein product, partial [Ectocarpus sp. 8 AP-2014]